MIRIPLPFQDWVFQLTPRFSHLGDIGQMIAVAVLIVLPLALLFWLYWYEMRALQPIAAVLLLGLRVVVVAALWFTVTFQPVLARSEIEQLPSRVLLLTDHSLSMSVPDPQRPAAEKLRLALALRLWPASDQPIESLLKQWIANYERPGPKNEPTWILDHEKSLDAESSARLAKTRMSLHDQIMNRMDKQTRLDLVRSLLSAGERDIISLLQKNHNVDQMGFHREEWAIATNGGKKVKAPAKRPEDSILAHFTDIHRPLARAVERVGKQDGKLIAVLLLTDGRHNWGETPVLKAELLGRRRIPIYPVAFGSKKSPPDISLTKVLTPANVLKGADANIQASVRVNGIAAQDLFVELVESANPASKRLTQTIKHDGVDRQYVVRFQLPTKRIGTRNLQVRVRPAKGPVREISEKNNAKNTMIRVTSDKAEVLVVDGEARWEYHFLTKALERDKTIMPVNVVFEQPRIGQIAKADLTKAGFPRSKLPEPAKAGKTSDPLQDYACIILGDVSPSHLPLKERQRLNRFVSDYGGTLVFVAGKRWMPLTYLNMSKKNAPELDPLAQMLPFLDLREVRPKDGFSATLTHDGQNNPYLQLEPTAEASRERWAALPKHYWGVIGRAKPGATALAYLTEKDLGVKKPAAQSKTEFEREHSLILSQNYGLGKVIFVGLDSTWRWRYRTGDLYHHRFWGQLIRWAASDKVLPAGNQYVRYGSTKPAYAQEEEVGIQVRVAFEFQKLLSKLKAEAKILRIDEGGSEKTVATVKLKKNSQQSRLLEGSVSNLPPGQYRIQLKIPKLEHKLPKSTDTNSKDTFVILPSESGELTNLSANWPLLQSLAQKSGGRVVTPDRVNELVGELNARIITREHRQEQRFWQDFPYVWFLLAGFLAFLTLEWTIRKFAGLP